MTQTDLPALQDGTLRLRAPCMDDVQARLALGNVPEIMRVFGVHADACQPLTVEAAEGWVKGRMATPMCWVIDYEDRLIGDTFFHSLNRHDRRASLALGLLDPALLGQGIGTRVLHLLIDYAFETMDMHRAALRVIDYNARAIAAYKKVGFVVEGRERQAARVGEAWHDDVIMGLLAPDYHAARAA